MCETQDLLAIRETDDHHIPLAIEREDSKSKCNESLSLLRIYTQVQEMLLLQCCHDKELKI